MVTIATERLGRVLIRIKEVPRMLTEAASTMPGTVRDTEVPHYFREHNVHSGYRPLNQSWSYYFLSLFQRHNETIDIWTHLLAFLVLLVKLRHLTETVDFVGDPHSWPLLVLVLSSLTYSALSALAHLLAAKSELCHYAFFFLDYVGVAQYQYGSALGYFYYSVDESPHRRVHGIFMPLATVLSCLSCLGCCSGKYCNYRLPTWVLKVGQVAPSVLTYLWDSSPVTERLIPWSPATNDPAIVYHICQVAFFVISAVFFIYPLFERRFPGQFDLIRQSHQLFNFFLSCSTMCQIHATHLDLVGHRKLYSRLHLSGEAALYVRLYVVALVVCVLVAVSILRKVKQVLDTKIETK